MALYEIPLDTTPDQQFRITVDINGENVPLVMRLRYNTEGDFWHMDISDGITGEMRLSNVPLLTGQYPAANIMRQFKYMGLGDAVIVKTTDGAESDSPDFYNLGTDFVLVWGSVDDG